MGRRRRDASSRRHRRRRDRNPRPLARRGRLPRRDRRGDRRPARARDAPRADADAAPVGGGDVYGAFYTLVPIRPRWRGGRRSLRTFAAVSLRPTLAFNTRPRRLSTPSDAYELHPNIRLYGQLPSAPAARRREAPSGACARRREIVWARPRPAGSICFGSCCVRTRARGSPPRRR